MFAPISVWVNVEAVKSPSGEERVVNLFQDVRLSTQCNASRCFSRIIQLYDHTIQNLTWSTFLANWDSLKPACKKSLFSVAFAFEFAQYDRDLN